MVSFAGVQRVASGFWVLLLPIAFTAAAIAAPLYFFLHPHLETVWTLRGNEFLSEAACYNAANKLNEPRPAGPSMRMSSNLPAARPKDSSLPNPKKQRSQKPIVSTCAWQPRILVGWEHRDQAGPLPTPSPSPGNRQKSR